MNEQQPRIYLGYSARNGAPPGRVTPLWVKFPCAVCGAETCIGPTQAADKARHGGDVACMLCAIKAGVVPEELVGLDNRLGQPHPLDSKRN